MLDVIQGLKNSLTRLAEVPFSAEAQLRRRGYNTIDELTAGCFAKVLVVESVHEEGRPRRIVKMPSSKISRVYGLNSDDPVFIYYLDRIQHITTEREILESVREVDGIAQLVDSFEIRMWYDLLADIDADSMFDISEFNTPAPVLVKEYIYGRDLGTCETIVGTKNQEVLRNAVRAIHERGYTIHDLRKENIIITPEGKPFLVDVGFAKYYPNCTEEFQKERDADLAAVKLFTTNS
jgi:serine/threonine protein kinase